MHIISSSTLPQKIFVILPATLFFPHGLVYAGVSILLLSIIATGGFNERLLIIRKHPFTVSVLIYSSFILLAAALSDWGREKFLSNLAHYETYIFLLLFIALDRGDWQKQALNCFYLSALIAATIFYATLLDIVPAVGPLKNFTIYNGNKSILLGILLAVAVGWLLLDLYYRFRYTHFAAMLYIAGALIFVTKSRTGYISLGVALLMLLIKSQRLSRKTYIVVAISLLGMSVVAWNYAVPAQNRLMETVHDVQTYSSSEIKKTSTTIRMYMLIGSAQMAIEKPVFGHGIGSWLPLFHERYGQALVVRETTPHNDYILYAFETGVIGLSAIVWLWWMQLRIGYSVGGVNGDRIVMLTSQMVIAALSTAIIRDTVFAMAFMILLAIPFAGLSKMTRQRQI